MALGTKSDVLECLLCGKGFNLRDAEKGRFFLETNICKECYRGGQKQPQEVWCFGKKQKSGRVGYSEKNIECTSICQDRLICKSFVKSK